MANYKAKLKDGREIYIPAWSIEVGFENLAQASKQFGSEDLILIADLNVPAAIVSFMECKEPKVATKLIKHFICQVRIDGSKITPETIENMFSGNLHIVIELFVHVIHSQYFDFFELGLAKVNSQDS